MDLSGSIRWLEFVPDLLGNRDAQRPFWFLLHGSISKGQLKGLDEALSQRVAVPELEPLPDKPTPEQQAEFTARKEEHDELVRLALVERYAKALEPFVRFGDEPLSFDGDPITTLRGYLDLVTRYLPGLGAFMETYNALLSINTLGGGNGFFSGRLSGGFTSTAPRSGKARSQTAAR